MSDITARVACVVAALALAAGLATAQESANYRISAGVVNAGGSPAGGLFARSGSFRLALSSLGEGVLGVPASSATSRHEGALVAGHAPVGEVRELVFVDRVTLAWRAEERAGAYNVYRDGAPFREGSASARRLAEQIVERHAVDAEQPGAGAAFFYLVTAVDRLGGEGL